MQLDFGEYSFDSDYPPHETTLISRGMVQYNFSKMIEQTISFQPAFLWDGSKQLTGKLELTTEVLHFYFDNFKDSKLDLKIRIEGISKTKLYSLYGLVPTGLEISDDQDRTYIFILHDPKSLRNLLQTRINSI